MARSEWGLGIRGLGLVYAIIPSSSSSVHLFYTYSLVCVVPPQASSCSLFPYFPLCDNLLTAFHPFIYSGVDEPVPRPHV